MSDQPIRVTTEVNRDDLLDGMVALGPQGLADLIKDADERMADWDFIRILGAWVDEESRKMVDEHDDLQAQTDPSRGSRVR